MKDLMHMSPTLAEWSAVSPLRMRSSATILDKYLDVNRHCRISIGAKRPANQVVQFVTVPGRRDGVGNLAALGAGTLYAVASGDTASRTICAATGRPGLLAIPRSSAANDRRTI